MKGRRSSLRSHLTVIAAVKDHGHNVSTGSVDVQLGVYREVTDPEHLLSGSLDSRTEGHKSPDPECPSARLRSLQHSFLRRPEATHCPALSTAQLESKGTWLLTWQLKGLLVVVKDKFAKDAESLVVLQKHKLRPFALLPCALCIA